MDNDEAFRSLEDLMPGDTISLNIRGESVEMTNVSVEKGKVRLRRTDGKPFVEDDLLGGDNE